LATGNWESSWVSVAVEDCCRKRRVGIKISLVRE